ncbi:MAG: STAS domain-containing protein, partial [Candidatus Atribacteria bacterium]|nr:STAS domain-containing protein [Candidatus Atribacteria bacterium]
MFIKLWQQKTPLSKKLIIDLTSVEFIDSTFLGVIVNSLKKVAKLGGDLKLV